MMSFLLFAKKESFESQPSRVALYKTIFLLIFS